MKKYNKKKIELLVEALESCVRRFEFLESDEAKFYSQNNKLWIDAGKLALEEWRKNEND